MQPVLTFRSEVVMNIRRVLVVLAASVFGFAALPALAQQFPDHPIHLIVPFPAGGSTDLAARVVGKRLSETLGQPVVVENRPGGGGQIAVGALMQAPADGHTLLIGDIGVLAINPSVFPKLSYDPRRDFQAIGLVMSSPMVLLVPAKSPARDAKALIERARNAQIAYASQGNGTGGHLIGELFKSETRTSLLHVPYKGGAPALQALLGSQVDMAFFVMGVALPRVQAGTARILAVAAPARSPRAPEVPTMAEIGYGNVVMDVWTGIVARSGTPEAIVRKLNQELVSAIANPEVAKPLNDAGYEARSDTPEEFEALMRSEQSRWAAVVKSTGAHVE
jgi:tripartite-type tricarboxylate transporter receptor subunit TctC